MSYRISVVAGVLATCAAIGVAQSLYGTHRSDGQSRSECVEVAHLPSADEIAMHEAAARGMLAYSGIQLAGPEAEEARTPDLWSYGAF